MMPPARQCPKCGRDIDRQATHCDHCGAPLVITCPRCGLQRPWYIPQCPRCEAHEEDEQLFAAAFNKAPQTVRQRYEIVDTLALGRVSAVYLVRDTLAKRERYALKAISPIALFRAEERREALSLYRAQLERWRAVSHPGLPKIHEAFSEREQQYVLMDYVEGWSLRQLIAQGYRATPNLAANWGAQLCEILAYLHNLNPPLYAPFLSPGHVMVNPAGQIYLVDLGLTWFFARGEYGPYGSVPGYGAPELRRGSPTPRSDQFSLARLLYAVLVGRLLERGVPRDLPLQRAVPDIPNRLLRAIARAAEREPEARFADLAALRRELWGEATVTPLPLGDWLSQEINEERPAQVRAPTSHSPTMADFGFEADPRYGPSRPRERPVSRPQAPARTPSPVAQARLSLYPERITVNDLRPGEPRRIALSLRNTGDIPIEGRFASGVTWLSAPSKPFRLPAGKTAKAIIRILPDRLEAEEASEEQALLVESNAGRKWIGASARLQPRGALRVSPSVLDYGAVNGEGQRALGLTVSNVGSRLLSATLGTTVDWLYIENRQLHLEPGEKRTVAVHLIADNLAAGPQSDPAAVLVDSDAGQERVEARVLVHKPLLEVHPQHLSLGDLLPGEQFATLSVRNPGDGRLIGRARSLVPFLQINPEAWSLGPDETTELQVRVDAAGLEGYLQIPEAISIVTNAGSLTIGLDLQVLAPHMSLDITHLDFGTLTAAEVERRSLVVRNLGSAPLTAQVQPLVPWLSVSAAVLEVAAGEAVTLEVSADPSALAQGGRLEREPALQLISGSTILTLTASLTALFPRLVVEPAELDFGYADPASPVTRTLTIANEGTGDLAWHAVSDATWVEVEPASGVVAAGQVQEVRLTAYGLALESGVEVAEAPLVINSDGGRAKIPLRLALAQPRLACDTTFLDLGESINYADLSNSFRVFNYGLGLLRGTIRASETWLVPGSVSFTCETGRSQEVRVTTDMAEFPEGKTYASGTIYVESNGGSAEVQAVVAVILEPEVTNSGPVVLTSSPEGGRWQGRLVLTNRGLAAAHVELLPSSPRLLVSREFCDIKPGKHVRIGVRWEGPEPPGDQWLDVQVQDGVPLHVPLVCAPEHPDEP